MGVEIKMQQEKIRDTIIANRVKLQNDKKKIAQDAYEGRRRTNHLRNIAKSHWNAFTSSQYVARISETQERAEAVADFSR